MGQEVSGMADRTLTTAMCRFSAASAPVDHSSIHMLFHSQHGKRQDEINCDEPINQLYTC